MKKVLEGFTRALDKISALLTQKGEGLTLFRGLRFPLSSLRLKGFFRQKHRKTGGEEKRARAAYRPLSVECLTHGMRARWLIRKASLATVAFLVFVALAMAGYLMVLHNSLWGVAMEAKGAREERTRLILELNNISRQIMASGAKSVMQLKTPEFFLPTPWKVTPVIARVLDVASRTGVGVQQVRYDRRKVNLGTLTLDVWWKWSPRTPSDDFVEFLMNVRNASPEISRVLVVSEQRTASMGRGRVVLVLTPAEKKGGGSSGYAASRATRS